MKKGIIFGCLLAIGCLLSSTANARWHTGHASIQPPYPGPVVVGQPVTVYANTEACYCDVVGCSITSYNWSAQGATPHDGSGTSFTFCFSTPGFKYVSLSISCEGLYGCSGFVFFRINVLENPDVDNDGMEDAWEITYGLHPNNSPHAADDPDGDGLTNLQEFGLQTNPQNPDTDGDGVDDGWEVGASYGGYGDNFYSASVQEALDPTQYDAYTKTVGQIPAIWWYTWWTYCDESEDSAIQAKKSYFEPTAPNAAEDTNLDNDTFTNLVEYQNGTDPMFSNVDDSWVEFVYDSTGKDPNEKQMVYQMSGGVLVEHCIAETTYDCDSLGRQWRTRQKANPAGAIDNSNDMITLTEYYVDGSVKRSVRKGLASTNPDAVDTSTPTKDVITAYTYDEYGRQYTVIGPTGEETTNHYNPTTGLLDVVDLPAKSGQTRTISYHYDKAERQYLTVNPDGNYQVQDLDSMGHVLISSLYKTVDTIDPLGSEINDVAVTQNRYLYDNLGTMVLEAVMKTASSSDPNSPWIDRLTSYAMDYSSPNKEQKKTVYSSAGEIVDYTWAESDVDSDASGRGLPTLIQKGYAEDDDSQPTIRQFMEYNAAGQKILQKTVHYASRDVYEPNVLIASETRYDDYGRVADIIQLGDITTSSDDLTTTYSYKGRQKVAEIDPKGLRTAYTYDVFGHIETRTEDADGLARTTAYAYNRLGNLVTLTADDDNNPANGVQTTQYAYDKASRVTQITYPDNGQITYQYTDPAAGGRPTIRTDQRSITTVYTYDKMGNLLTRQNAETNPTLVESYTYYPNGLMWTAKKGTPADDDSISSVTMTYNGLGYMETSKQIIKGGDPRTVSYHRDQLGQMTQLTIPTDTTPTVLDYTYTSLGQVDTITRNSETTPLVDYSYMGTFVAGRAYSTTSVVNYQPQYDKFGRMSRSTTVNSATPAVGVDFGYTYDANGNIESQTYYHRPNTPANGFGYDDLNRLTKASYRIFSGDENNNYEEFNYDLLGNRDSTTDSRTGGVNYTYASNWINEYTDITPGTFDPDYDLAGNLIQDKNGYKYAYDYENRLTQIARQDNTVIATFEYDALGRRIEVKSYREGQLETTVQNYYNDQQIVLQERLGSPSQSTWFVYGNYIDEMLHFGWQFETTAGPRFYVGHDHLYSPTVIYSSGGAVVERYEYDVYGNVRFLDTDDYSILPDGSSWGNPYYFTGRELDLLDLDENDVPRLKLMYYRARSYDPQTGRFLQRDPLQYVDGMNLYQYVNSSPLINRDASGLCCSSFSLDPIDIIIGEIETAIEKWIACRLLERAIAGYVTGHLDDAWRNFTGMSNRRDPVVLSGADMDEVFGDYDIENRLINPLVEDCKASQDGWKDKVTRRGLDGGRYKDSYGQYYRNGSWGATLGGVSFTATTTCIPCERKLIWSISLNDPWDFDNFRSGAGQIPRNIIVALIKFPNAVFECGWRNFNHQGEKDGVNVW